MRRYLFAALMLSVVTATACSDSRSRTESRAACCDQPKIPPGVAAFTVVADEVSGPGDGQVVRLKAALTQPAERQDVYPVLHTLYAWALTRTAFEPIEFRAELFASQAQVAAGKPIAFIERGRESQAPVCDNAVPWSFRQAVTRAFEASLNRAPAENAQDSCRVEKPKPAARFDESFAHQAKLEVNEAARSASVEYPYLADGKDEFGPLPSFNQALTYWIEFATSMFRRAPDLKVFKFVGVHASGPVVTIVMDRNSFESTFASLQEDVASHAAVTFQKLGVNAINDKAAAKEQEAFKAQTFRAALKQLPAAQVSIAKSLK